MHSLPTEVFIILYKYLQKSNILQCALVCKSWKDPALQYLYKEVKLDTYTIYLTKKQLKLSPNERKNYFQYGSFVKTFIIKEESIGSLEYKPRDIDTSHIKDIDCEFDRDDLLLLLRYMPNLQVLNMGDSFHVAKYFKYIYEAETDYSLLKVEMISPANHARIFRYSEKSLADYYFAVCYKYRAFITTLKLQHKDSMFDLEHLHGKMLTLLSHFDHLTHLTYMNTPDGSLTTFDILDACSHLISLEYYSDCDIPDSIVDKILGDTNRKKVNSSLKALHISVPFIPANYARYITQYVSSQVNELHLNMNEVDLYDWIDIIGEKNALSLVQSLSLLKNSHIIWHPYKDYERESTSNESNVTIFFKLLHAFKGNKQTYCSGSYGDFRRVHNSMSYSSDDGIDFEYGLSYSDYYLPDTQEEEFDEGNDMNQSTRAVQIALPDTSISTIGLEAVNIMQVIMCDTNPDLPLKFLQYALSNCTHLQYFLYDSMNSPHHTICIGTDVDINAFYGKGSMEKLKHTTQENIKVLKTRNTFPSKELLDMIGYMPALEHIVCGIRSYGLGGHIEKIYEMDLTALESLNLISLDAPLLVTRDTNMAFIEFHYADGDRNYFSLDVKKNCHFMTPTTMEYTEDHLNTDNVISRSLVVKCEKHVKFTLYDRYSVVAEIINGEVTEPSTSSLCFVKPFLN